MFLLGTFRDVLTVPRVWPVVASSLLARLPKGMVPLATVLLLHQATGSYAIAGATAALIAIGDAVSTPLQGRMVDRFGVRRVLAPLACIHVVGVAALLWFVAHGAPVGGLLVGAGVAGLGVPPVSGSVKAVWPRLVEKSTLPAAYTVESLLQQLVFLAGPLLVAAVSTVAGPAMALGAAAGMVAAGTGWFVAVAPATVRTGRRSSGALRVPTVSVLVVGTLLQSVAFGAIPVGLSAVALENHTAAFTGPVQAMLTFGGILGTFAPAGVPSKRVYVRLTAGFAATLVPVAVLAARPSLLLAIGGVLAVAGLFLTPIAATSYVLTEKATDASHRTEAFGWLSTGQAAGNAVGAALAGPLVDHAGPVLALAILPATVALAALVTRWRLSD